MIQRTFSQLSRLRTFEERFNYLSLRGGVGRSTFGFDRWMNQRFYASREWQHVRDYVIARDLGCDLGVPGHEIHAAVLVHHLNPMSPSDISGGEAWITDPEYLVTTCHRTHNAIHFGVDPPAQSFQERSPGDTTLW